MTATPVRPWLDWSHARHWGSRDRRCRYCGRPTPLLDDDRKPSHKTCAEQALITELHWKDTA